jgi:DEAD/DEAH box helicase domain-containing protein
MDLERRIVELEYTRANYYTQAAKQTSLSLDQLLLSATKTHGRKYLGKVTVTTQVVGFKKIRFYTQEILGFEDLELPSRELKTVAWWLSLSGIAVQNIRDKGLWRNAPNEYGAGWIKIKDAIRARDGYICQHCKIPESGKAHDVHHIIPFRKYSSAEEANREENLITLCPRCHRLAEQSVMIQSGLAAVSYLLGNLAPLYVMCEQKDLGVHSEENSELASGDPIIVIYDSVPGGIGLSKKLYHLQEKLVSEALLAVQNCPCEIGCPSCVGPVAENGSQRARSGHIGRA